MTENELIKTHIEECEERIGRILGYMETAEDANTKFCERNVEVLKSVVIALEEIQQYRAMEEKLNGISVKEVVDGFISAVEKETCEGYERGRILTNEDAEKWNAYRGIGTVEEVKELKEKATPKKVQYDEYGKEGYPYCECGKCLIDDFVGATYCPYCGQKLDWEGGE